MKLINAGLARTGTTSLKAALETLGFAPVHHTFDLFTSPKDMHIWEAAFKGQPVNWRAFYSNYEVADWPAGLFYKEIINAHPDAKVIITVRDLDQWYESINSTLKKGLSLNLPIPHLRRIQRFIGSYAVNKLFDGKVDDKAHMVRCFENHVEGVKEFVPADRRLVYSVRDGWEPLCKFLEVDVPQKPFPRVNTRGGFKGIVMRVLAGLKS